MASTRTPVTPQQQVTGDLAGTSSSGSLPYYDANGNFIGYAPSVTPATGPIIGYYANGQPVIGNSALQAPPVNSSSLGAPVNQDMIPNPTGLTDNPESQFSAGGSAGSVTGSGTGTTGSGTSNGTDQGQSPQVANATQLPLQPFSTQTLNVTEDNVLNNVYQPTYHWRLFVTSDQDILTQAGGAQGNFVNLLSAISNGAVNQITIAESGVSGYGIREVEMETRAAQNAHTTYQQATHIKMTIIDPLGVNFLDGLFAATAALGVNNYTKSLYYLELTFTGYDLSGQWANRPLNPTRNMPNGGRWIYAMKLNNIETKLTEAGGTFILDFVNVESYPLTTKNNPEELQRIPQQALVVSGTTVRDIFADFVTKINTAWKKQYNEHGTDSLVTLKAIQTHKITIGPQQVLNKDPGDFVLKAQAPFKSSQRTWHFDSDGGGKVTCHIPPHATINEFILATIKATETGQMLIIDTPDPTKIDSSSTQPTDRGFRESTLFSIEPDIKYVAFDTKTHNYAIEMTYHVEAHYTQAAILSDIQRDAAKSGDVQRSMLNALIKNGLYKKRYDYIFTGKNTEILDLNIDWNMAWQAILPKMVGARMGIDNAATHALVNDVNKDPTNVSTASADLLVQNLEESNTQINIANTLTTQNAESGALVGQQQVPIGPLTSQSSQPDLTQTHSNLVSLGATSRLNAPNTANSEVSTGTGTNIYIEDVLNRIENNPNATLQDLALPVSFWHSNTDYETGYGYTGQFHRGLSVVGSVFAQIWENPLTSSFQKIEMTIRGDPFWLGQTNLERQIVLRSNAPTYDPNALPDYVSAQHVFYLHFQYPIQMGDDFKPVLKTTEVFDGFYSVTHAKHTFSEGVFKTVLTANRIPLLSMQRALNGGSTSDQISGGSGSNSQLANGGSTTAPGGFTPASSGFTLDPTNLPNVTAQPTDIQSSDTTTLGNLSAQQFAYYKAAIGQSESGNNPLQGDNGLGHVGQYQMGMAALQDTGYVSGGNPKQPSTWTWTGQNGINSLSDFLANANVQNSAMNQYTASNYNTLVSKGTITSSSTPDQVAGFLGAAHIAGAGGATNYARGNGNPSDAFGTSTGKYYALGYNASRLSN